MDWVEIDGTRDRLVVHTLFNADPRLIVVLLHGYGEHAGRYWHVSDALAAGGAAVYAPDQLGHGASGGERALVEDVDDLVADLGQVVEHAASQHPDKPLALIGHSMGGIVATLYAQRHSHELAALVLSGPVIGGNPEIEALLGMDPLPEVPIDPAVLSRDVDVQRAYADDPLVWHGPFKRPTLETMFGAVDKVAQGPTLGALATLWIHGELDELAPLAETRAAIERIRGERFEERVYPGARHEVFNEVNRDEVLTDVGRFLTRATADRVNA